MKMAKKDKYSVGQLSKASGISVRTLHFYDQKNLLKAKRDINGYRFYSDYDAALLQQIIIYRQMDMTLDDIANIINADNFDLLSALHKQHELLIQRRENTNDMIKRIEVSIKMAKGEENLDAILKGLPQAKVDEWKSQIKQDENGDEVFEFYGKLPEEDIHNIKDEADEWTRRYMEVTHLPVYESEVQKLIKEAYIIMNRMFYKSKDDFSGVDYDLLKVIIADGRLDSVVVDIYETLQKGLAKHYFDAMDFFAENSLNQNEEEFVRLQ
ncbi:MULTISPECIES: MerR family transcriptional regulator [unclassified Alteromonas]|uniref:MerR family transcriptional regulator n=1 Tax=unclassified Alteromonas TaxID=2614992 RepID=UPI000A7680C7|nr:MULTISPECIES: MerR family transcriptional regulator [unclassified Alteromonas]